MTTQGSKLTLVAPGHWIAWADYISPGPTEK